ncbi:MAG: PHB depolymerase family esterase [Hyphomicrobiaceae bacterium]|nr:PHB depolymerase family esterase [Hyphomicrobiaceae bacterium]
MRAYQPKLVALFVMALALLAGAGSLTADARCGGVEAACVVAGGTYHVVVPQGPAKPGGYPVMIFLHGWSSAGAAILQHPDLASTLERRGYVLIAPDGAIRHHGRRDWNLRDGQQRAERDEVAFLEAVIEDVGRRVSIDRGRMLLAGFSRGGSMVWDIACRSPGMFAAYAPVGGGFWLPLPTGCAGPVRLFHTHAWEDPTFPLEGRTVGDRGLVQGDLFAGLAIWRRANACRTEPPQERRMAGDTLWRAWTACAAGSDLRLAIVSGGHAVPVGWAARALDWLERVVPIPSHAAVLR